MPTMVINTINSAIKTTEIKTTPLLRVDGSKWFLSYYSTLNIETTPPISYVSKNFEHIILYFFGLNFAFYACVYQNA